MTIGQKMGKASTTKLMVGAVLLGLACSSYAQFGGGGGMGGGMGGMGGMRKGGGGGGQSERPTESTGRVPLSLEQVNSKLYDLRLLITPEQAPAWEGFRNRFIDLATARPPAVSAVESQSALQTMQRQLSVAQDKFTLMESLYEAHKVLFASLSPDQQRTADQTVPPLLSEIGPGISSPSAGRMSSR